MEADVTLYISFQSRENSSGFKAFNKWLNHLCYSGTSNSSPFQFIIQECLVLEGKNAEILKM
jgi:hypothetical protein